MRAVFQGKQRLVPVQGDLCYYAWGARSVTCHSSPSFMVSPALKLTAASPHASAAGVVSCDDQLMVSSV